VKIGSPVNNQWSIQLIQTLKNCVDCEKRCTYAALIIHCVASNVAESKNLGAICYCQSTRIRIKNVITIVALYKNFENLLMIR
jgi:hypothetical protein